jgi:hypothetical protein
LGIFLRLVNFTKLLAECEVQPIIVNDLSNATEDNRRFIDGLVSVRYDNTDLFSNEPMCECSTVKGGYNLGVICSNCRTPVREPFDQQLKPLIWMRSPLGVEPLINPMIWTMLNEKFVKGQFRLIEWICNTDYQPAAHRPNEVNELIALGVERGYNNFVKNFDKIIEILFSLKHFKPKKNEKNELLELLRMQRDCIFSNYLPLPNKSLMIVENTSVGIYIDPIIIGALDAIRTISSIDAPLANLTLRQKENRTAKTLSMLAKFYHEIYHSVFAGKVGLFRKHVFGGREHFTCRAVISSTTKAHVYDELHIGWGQGVTMLSIHLTNKLLKLRYTPNQCAALLQEYTTKYSPLLDRLMQELIDESPDKGLYCIFGRNPSLARSSAQRFKITKVKPDPDDPTIGLPILSVAGFNA